MLAFQDRNEELELICSKPDKPELLNFYGEAGIGKSRLLEESKDRLLLKFTDCLVVMIKLEQLAKNSPVERLSKLLGILISQSDKQLINESNSNNNEEQAERITARLVMTSKKTPIFMMIDTTEVLQQDMEFWRWVEEHLIGPIAVDGQIKLIVAGRVPAPWRRLEVRRIVRLYHLAPLPLKDFAANLIHEVFQQYNFAQGANAKKNLEEATDLVLEFSFGHPQLSEKLGAFVATQKQITVEDKFRELICQQVVKPFIEEELFLDISDTWQRILWWISLLNWFDITIIQRYLARVEPDLQEPDYFFIQGITQLRLQHTIIWREEVGDRLHGTVADIIRQCLKTLEPENYQKGNLAAEETFQELVDEFEPEEAEADWYRNEARIYGNRVELEKQS
jgi:hypothetical protein